MGIVLLLALQSALSAQAAAQDPERLLAQAIDLHRSGDVEGAIREYKAFLAFRPEHAEARSNLSAALARLGRYEESTRVYKHALALRPDNAGIRMNLALANYKSAQIGKAVEEISQIIQAQPENTNALILMADCQLEMGNNKKVIDLLSPREESLADDRAFAYLLGTALIRDGQPQRGQRLVDKLLRNGDSAEANLMLGTAMFMAGDFAGARDRLRRAVQLNPGLPAVHSFYGQALMATGEQEEAAAEFRKELELNAGDFDANLHLGVLERQDQRFDDALQHLGRALRARPGDPAVRYQIAAIYLAQGRVDDARQLLEHVIKEAPGFVEAHVSLATAYYRLKRKSDGDRERDVVEKLKSEQQGRQPGAQDKLGPAYRGESATAPKPR